MVYDASGERILKKEGTLTTLSVAGTELSVDTASGVMSASRYYEHAGQTVAVRTGNTNADLFTVITDRQGSAHHQIRNSDSQLVTTWQGPFGVTRGSAGSSWVGQRGFVGGANDATGLVRLGARDYDPLLGKFLTVDPLQDLGDPLQWNPYIYANNSPVTRSDPSGLMVDGGPRECGGVNTMSVGSGSCESAPSPFEPKPKKPGPVKPKPKPHPVKPKPDPHKRRPPKKAPINPAPSPAPSLPDDDDDDSGPAPVNPWAGFGHGGFGQLVQGATIGIYASGGGGGGGGRSGGGYSGGGGSRPVSAESPVSARDLGRSLASEQQMGEPGIPVAGAGTNTGLRAAERLARTYGGSAGEWSKKSSLSYRGPDGFRFETHWYENAQGHRFEFKIKFWWGS